MNVLILDDVLDKHPILAKYAELILAHSNHCDTVMNSPKVFNPLDLKITYYTDAQSAINHVSNCNTAYNLIFLDHDLGDGIDGIGFAKFIDDNDLCIKSNIIIHSMNPVGVQNMKDELKHYIVHIVPYKDILKTVNEIK